MPYNEIADHYRLLGENAPNWLIFTLVLIGFIGSVMTVQLLVYPEMTRNKVRSWFGESALEEQVDLPPLPVADGVERPVNGSKTTASQKPAATSVTSNGHISPDLKNGSAVRKDVNSKTGTIEFDAATALLTDSPDMGALEQKITTSSPDLPATSFIADLNGITNDDKRMEAGQARQNEITDEEQVSMAKSEVVAETAVTAVADHASNQSTEMSVQTRTQSPLVEVDTQDCAPLFFAEFQRGEVEPMDRDLAQKAARLREWLERHPQVKLLIEGHTDSYGPEQLNLIISHQRAKSVAKILSNAGVPDRQMTIRAFGEYSPLSGVSPESSRNRRVTLRIENVKACEQAESDGDI